MVSYKPLMHLLVERELSKHDLQEMAKISPNTMTKIRNNEEVSMAVLNRICEALNCNYGDIISYDPSLDVVSGGCI